MPPTGDEHQRTSLQALVQSTSLQVLVQSTPLHTSPHPKSTRTPPRTAHARHRRTHPAGDGAEGVAFPQLAVAGAA